ncbi:hypothetical protein QE435_004970 [Rhizobium sp. SORGH_AS 787]|nr:hypothetical protein [Rhizobium sp. SORGH_AS_0787]
MKLRKVIGTTSITVGINVYHTETALAADCPEDRMRLSGRRDEERYNACLDDLG